MNIKESIREIIKVYRQNHRLTQEELAEFIPTIVDISTPKLAKNMPATTTKTQKSNDDTTMVSWYHHNAKTSAFFLRQPSQPPSYAENSLNHASPPWCSLIPVAMGIGNPLYRLCCSLPKAIDTFTSVKKLNSKSSRSYSRCRVAFSRLDMLCCKNQIPRAVTNACITPIAITSTHFHQLIPLFCCCSLFPW